jgi:hypothetical protein
MLKQLRAACRRLALGPTQSVGAVDDRRESDRHPLEREVTFFIGRIGLLELTGLMRDVSRGGMRLLVDQEIGCGSVIRVRVPLPAGNPEVLVLACVVHAEPAAGGAFEIGCAFAGELSDAELRLLGVTGGERPDAEQRQSERTSAAGHVRFSRVNYVAEKCPAEIHNISLSGVAFFSERSVTPGNLLEVELCDHEGRPIVSIVACVVYVSRPKPGQWLVGCNFIRELHEAEFQEVVSGRP